ncbi:GNAT family N-acetyltransferase [Kitasatospora phosalacinea]|uniref:Acetyltransferase n=1 Tax=Kitasatospora phosalacinea TaxID=2065 RepID=A0A9W6PH31_9ACTN|nr:GNAT family N-acetyltransferase [Kitasatospora phosalacinea]GLW54742.1 acetyltransferase [Kitasatospora phosalacinea]
MSDTVQQWPTAVEIATESLRLEPLRAAHAAESFELFDDVLLHAWTGGEPLARDELRARYRRLAAGRSPDGTQGWLNWMLRRTADGLLVGTVQATLERTADGRLAAELAWVVGTAHQGRGHAREGALAMARWLREQRVDVLLAHVHPGHAASAGVARALGLAPTGTVVDGEVRWSSDASDGSGSDGGGSGGTAGSGGPGRPSR